MITSFSDNCVCDRGKECNECTSWYRHKHDSDSIYTVMPKRENFYVRDPKLQSFGQLLEENSTLPRILYLS